MVFSEIESALSILDRVKSYLKRKPKNETELIASRFTRLFESHGVHRNQIPGFFGHGLSFAKLKGDNILLNSLTEEMLHDACKLFAVRREWLDGVDEQIYPLHDFYKYPENLIEFLESLKRCNDGYVAGVLIAANSNAHEFDALLILKEQIGEVGEKLIFRYHLCNNWIMSYWKARAYLTACIACAWRQNIHIMGRRVSIDIIRRYTEGCELLDYRGQSALPVQGEHWYPEDMLIDPAAFLDGLREGNFGDVAGLKLWLELYKQGLLQTDLPYDDVYEKFEAALNKIIVAV